MSGNYIQSLLFGNVFDTDLAIQDRDTPFFIDSLEQTAGNIPSVFDTPSSPKHDESLTTQRYDVSVSVSDNSGQTRSILSPGNTFTTTVGFDSFRQGIEIKEFKHWDAGFFKIWSGTKGHLYDHTLYGDSLRSAIFPSVYTDLEEFNPALYLEYSTDPMGVYSLSYAVDDKHDFDNDLNGQIEPIPIRTLNRNTNVPFETYGIKSVLLNGNTHAYGDSDVIENVYEIDNRRRRNVPFVEDLAEMIFVKDGVKNIIFMEGYFNLETSKILAFHDADEAYNNFIEIESGKYSPDLAEVLIEMPDLGGSLVPFNKKSAAAGFFYQNTPQGTDSIAYGGLLY